MAVHFLHLSRCERGVVRLFLRSPKTMDQGYRQHYYGPRRNERAEPDPGRAVSAVALLLSASAVVDRLH